MTKAELEQKLGQLVFEMAKKQNAIQPTINEIQKLQAEVNEVAKEIEKLG